MIIFVPYSVEAFYQSVEERTQLLPLDIQMTVLTSVSDALCLPWNNTPENMQVLDDMFYYMGNVSCFMFHDYHSSAKHCVLVVGLGSEERAVPAVCWSIDAAGAFLVVV